ncbi:hypothetical protein KP509_13G088300 [Ceratopteris richardii]|uniref:Amino acid transporter transmembrane domain-containing protein n=1 Tax=Ceratopteris richardii TaxID=49495 RepID=A0A8T2THF6_CERRI|nr:hypothetical protein KP509_13G088300 [Ceratopteris richardii]KAH7422053.1 hypothetical protein KP509_13G088300 [Ceratopteris richardii]KAH7422054.1 hypothetical protein KP509_13G088300 [Ceratopteris richardii]KAH7422055.1 hypothetical protein KP509_13G088300 [Ceratopteris richardii]KAH7422056.1 hypothetical protein KP509_13G088300 [Ceratopteris richardii]
MLKNQSLSTLEGHIYVSEHSDDEICRTDDKEETSDTSLSPPGSPLPSRPSQGSFNQTPVWPQSYRQSMDAYSSFASPGISFLSPGLSHVSASYISSSLRRRTKSTQKLSPLTATLLPTKSEKPETPKYELIPSVEPKYPSSVAAEAAHGIKVGCSGTQAVLNGINVLCGVGVLTTPYAVNEGGWLSLLVLLLLAIVSWYTGILLRRCLDNPLGLETYPDIGQAAFGMTGRFLVSIILYAELYACCVEFLILEGDNLSALFPNARISLSGFRLTGTELFTVMTAIFVLPTVWLRNLSLLSYVSAGGVIASILVVLCVIWVGVVDGVGFHKTGPLLTLSNIPLSIGLYGFCYSGHAVFPNIYKSLKKPSQFTTVLTISFIICTTMYGGMAVMGFRMFGSNTESQITLNLPKDLLASKIALWTTVVNPFTKYALTITPVALSLEELFPLSFYSWRGYWVSMTIRTILVMSTLCVALLVPFFGYVMSLIGSLLSMLVCVILPAACFLKLAGNAANILEKIVCIFIVLIGIACAASGTYSSLVGIIESFGNA